MDYNGEEISPQEWDAADIQDMEMRNPAPSAPEDVRESCNVLARFRAQLAEMSSEEVIARNKELGIDLSSPVNDDAINLVYKVRGGLKHRRTEVFCEEWGGSFLTDIEAAALIQAHVDTRVMETNRLAIIAAASAEKLIEYQDAKIQSMNMKLAESEALVLSHEDHIETQDKRIMALTAKVERRDKLLDKVETVLKENGLGHSHVALRFMRAALADEEVET